MRLRSSAVGCVPMCPPEKVVSLIRHGGHGKTQVGLIAVEQLARCLDEGVAVAVGVGSAHADGDVGGDAELGVLHFAVEVDNGGVAHAPSAWQLEGERHA